MIRQPAPPPADDPVRLAAAHMDRHYARSVTLAELGREAGYSGPHLIRLFKRQRRVTPHQYLLDRRLAAARVLLAAGELPVTEVCFRVGFRSLGSFSSLFRRRVGMSPARYRTAFARRPAGAARPVPGCFAKMFGQPAP
jgi:AraC-like DNA-binding protein